MPGQWRLRRRGRVPPAGWCGGFATEPAGRATSRCACGSDTAPWRSRTTGRGGLASVRGWGTLHTTHGGRSNCALAATAGVVAWSWRPTLAPGLTVGGAGAATARETAAPDPPPPLHSACGRRSSGALPAMGATAASVETGRGRLLLTWVVGVGWRRRCHPARRLLYCRHAGGLQPVAGQPPHLQTM